MMLLAQLTPEVSKLAHYCTYIIVTRLPLFLYCHIILSLSFFLSFLLSFFLSLLVKPRNGSGMGVDLKNLVLW